MVFIENVNFLVIFLCWKWKNNNNQIYLFPKHWVHIYFSILCFNFVRFRFVAQVNFLFVICIFRENVKYSETGKIRNWNCLKKSLRAAYHENCQNCWFRLPFVRYLYYNVSKFTFLTQFLINFWCSKNPIAVNVIKTTIVENGTFLNPLINILSLC